MPNPKTAKSSACKLTEEPTRKNMLTSKEANQAAQQHEMPASDSDSLAADISQSVTERISALMDKKFAEFATTLSNISAKLEANTERITDAEHRISAVEDDVLTVEPRLKELESKVRILTEKCIDLEGRNRRDNILIFNLKEDTEGRQPRWLPTLLGLECKRGVIKIDRAHQSLGPPRRDRPRAVIVKLHHSRDTSRILATARKQPPLTYEGQTIVIRQDMTAAVKDMRRAFNEVCELLIKKDIKFSMRYPAVLSYSHGGKTRSALSKKLEAARSALNQILTKQAESSIFFAKYRLYQSGNKPGRLLARLTKGRMEANTISSLQDNNRDRHHKTTDINRVMREFYQKLYTSECDSPDAKITKFLSGTKFGIPKEHFFGFLQIRHFIGSMRFSHSGLVMPNEIERFLDKPPTITQWYREIFRVLPHERLSAVLKGNEKHFIDMWSPVLSYLPKELTQLVMR
ncbi:unnamed protein product, partial [Menidia menidia]